MKIASILFAMIALHTAHGLITGKPMLPPDAWLPWCLALGSLLGLWLWLSDHVKELTGIAIAMAPPPPKTWAVGVAGLGWALPFFGDYLFPLAGFARPWEWTSLLFWALFTVVAAYAISPPWKTPHQRSPR